MTKSKAKYIMLLDQLIPPPPAYEFALLPSIKSFAHEPAYLFALDL